MAGLSRENDGGACPADYKRPARDTFTHEDIRVGIKTMTVTIDEECRVQHFHGGLCSCPSQSGNRRM